tara:strand:- start:108 stop:401 length:294 start_codon:yes stop_codon:yes gene_type:complete
MAQQPPVSQMTPAELKKFIEDKDESEELTPEQIQDIQNQEQDKQNADGLKKYNENKQNGKAHGGKVNKMAKGGKVKKSSTSRGDGIAQRGKTKGRMV